MYLNNDPLNPTIFHEPWWLEAATDGQYDVVEVMEGGQIAGRLPYHLKKKAAGMHVIDLPPLTHFLGPVITRGQGKPSTQFLRRLDLTKDLIRKLPKASFVYIKCHRDVSDVVAFQGSGFRTGVQFTHELHPQPIEEIWKNIRDKARNSVSAARRKYTIASGEDPAGFMQFYADCLEQNKGVTNSMCKRTHANLIQACMERGRGKIYEARERDGSLAAAIFCAWDSVASYYLLTSRSPKAHSSSTNLLVWEAITDAMKRNLIFDFDGVSSESGARAATNFADVLSPRYTATFESTPLRILRAHKAMFKQTEHYY